MNDAPHPLEVAAEPLSIVALREELGLTQLEFGERIGLANKASVSLIERGLGPCSLRVAVAIEELSGGRIDAAGLNEDVRLSRHGAANTPDSAPVSRGKGGELSLPPLDGARAERGVVA